MLSGPVQKTKREFDEALGKLKQSLIEWKIKNSSNKTKTTWNIINNIRKNPKASSNRFPQGSLENVVKQFNKYFIEKAHNMDPNNSEQGAKNKSLPSINPKSFYMFEVTVDEVTSAVRNL